MDMDGDATRQIFRSANTVNKKVHIYTLLLLFTVVSAKAQFRLPQFDIEAKGGFTMIDAGGNDGTSNPIHRANFSSFQAGLHVQFSQRIALGGFYDRSFGGEIVFGSGSTSTEYPLSVLMYGVDLRFSAGRSAKWRPYIGLVYGKAEFVQQTGNYNLAAQSNVMGVNLGIMLLFGRNFYWNILEISPRYLPDKIFWINSDFMIAGKTGFTYNIRLKNK